MLNSRKKGIVTNHSIITSEISLIQRLKVSCSWKGGRKKEMANSPRWAIITFLGLLKFVINNKLLCASNCSPHIFLLFCSTSPACNILWPAIPNFKIRILIFIPITQLDRSFKDVPSASSRISSPTRSGGCRIIWRWCVNKWWIGPWRLPLIYAPRTL